MDRASRSATPVASAARRTLWIAGVIIVITVIAAIGIAAGRGGLLVPDWYGSAPINPPIRQLLAILLILAIYLAGARALIGQAAGWLVVWSAVGSAAVTLGVLALGDNPLHLLFACTISRGCTGGYSLSLELTPAMLRAWPELMPAMRPTLPHLSISAPGWPLAYRGMAGILAGLPSLSQPLASILRPLRCDQWDFLALSNAQVASAWLGLASPLWAGLTAVPLYFFARDIAGEWPARTAVAWWPLVPATAMFAATLSNTYALLGTAAVTLFWRGFQVKGWARAALWLVSAGAVLGLALVLSFSLVPVLLLCAVLGICSSVSRTDPYHEDATRSASLRGDKTRSEQKDVGAIGRGDPATTAPAGGNPGRGDPAPTDRARHKFETAMLGLGFAVARGLIFAVGITAVWALFWLLTGASPVRIFLTGMGIHAALPGSYLDWLGLESWDFLLFLGLPVAGLALAPLLTRHLDSARCLAVALGVTLPVLLLSGTARGEVGRVWIFFMPMLVLLAAAVLPQFTSGQRRGLLAAQAGWLLVLGASFTPVNSWLIVPDYAQVVRAPAAPLSAPVVPVMAVFADALQLNGYQAEYQPGLQTLALSLHWQALEPIDRPYYFSAVLVSPDGQALPGINWQPLAGRYPTTCWQRGATAAQPVVDRVELPLGANAQPGDWWLSLSAFGMAGDKALPRLPVRLADGTRDTQVGLGPVRVGGDAETR